MYIVLHCQMSDRAVVVTQDGKRSNSRHGEIIITSDIIDIPYEYDGNIIKELSLKLLCNLDKRDTLESDLHYKVNIIRIRVNNIVYNINNNTYKYGLNIRLFGERQISPALELFYYTENNIVVLHSFFYNTTMEGKSAFWDNTKGWKGFGSRGMWFVKLIALHVHATHIIMQQDAWREILSVVIDSTQLSYVFALMREERENDNVNTSAMYKYHQEFFDTEYDSLDKEQLDLVIKNGYYGRYGMVRDTKLGPNIVKRTFEGNDLKHTLICTSNTATPFSSAMKQCELSKYKTLIYEDTWKKRGITVVLNTYKLKRVMWMLQVISKLYDDIIAEYEKSPTDFITTYRNYGEANLSKDYANGYNTFELIPDKCMRLYKQYVDENVLNNVIAHGYYGKYNFSSISERVREKNSLSSAYNKSLIVNPNDILNAASRIPAGSVVLSRQATLTQ